MKDIDLDQTPACWELFDSVQGQVSRLLLHGKPGTGKSYAAAMAALDRAYVVTLTEDTPSAEIRGHFLPKGTSFEWHDGVAMRAWRSGGRLVLNEIDHASGEVLTLLLAILDDQSIARLTLPNGETVYPSEGFDVVATMNGDPSNLPEALLDRFDSVLDIDTPHSGIFAKLPKDLRYAASRTFGLDEARRVSPRAWLSFASLREKIGEDLAARAVFGVRASAIRDSLVVARDRK